MVSLGLSSSSLGLIVVVVLGLLVIYQLFFAKPKTKGNLKPVPNGKLHWYPEVIDFGKDPLDYFKQAQEKVRE